jgi:hypothetical protein
LLDNTELPEIKNIVKREHVKTEHTDKESLLPFKDSSLLALYSLRSRGLPIPFFEDVGISRRS